MKTASFTFSSFRGPAVTRANFDAMSPDGYHAVIEARLVIERPIADHAHEDDYRWRVTKNGVGSRHGHADTPELAARACESALRELRGVAQG